MLGATLSIHSHMQNMSHGKRVENMCAKLLVDYPGSHLNKLGIYVQIYHIQYFLQSSYYCDTAEGGRYPLL